MLNSKNLDLLGSEKVFVSYNQNTIEIKNLRKIYTGKKVIEEVKAVDGISFSIKNGEIFGLLGPNGAGKTTIINILCGLVNQTEGDAFIGGYDVKKNLRKIKELIGVCPQQAAVYQYLSAKENIEFFGKLHLMDDQEIKDRSKEFLELLGLSDASDKKAKKYSGGMLRQLNLIIALISDPPILFLDEPTVGMDPRVRRRTWKFISSLKESNKTVVLTTHYIEEAEELCDRVAIIDYGKLIAIGSPKDLIREHRAKDLEEVFLKITGRRIMEGV
ncbi:MAG: ABC transporter ATP-binding protein [Candidatus Lokiarchaeota archaeon]|nr:ABC transporter ATP-binding protein [Candidatus Lokiarchaeota archaeon]